MKYQKIANFKPPKTRLKFSTLTIGDKVRVLKDVYHDFHVDSIHPIVKLDEYNQYIFLQITPERYYFTDELEKI